MDGFHSRLALPRFLEPGDPAVGEALVVQPVLAPAIVKAQNTQPCLVLEPGTNQIRVRGFEKSSLSQKRIRSPSMMVNTVQACARRDRQRQGEPPIRT